MPTTKIWQNLGHHSEVNYLANYLVKDRYFRFQTWVCENVSNEVLLAWFKLQTKTPRCSGVSVQWAWQKSLLPPRRFLKTKTKGIFRLRLQCYGFIFDSLWQFITKCDRYYYKMQPLFYYKNTKEVYYKMRQVFYYKMQQLLEIATISLPNATFITNCDSVLSHVSCLFKLIKKRL